MSEVVPPCQVAPQRQWLDIELVMLLGFCLALFFWRLGDTIIIDEDAALYLRTAREVLISGDWITLRFNGNVWFDKPPLTIWLMALSIRSLGMNEWAFRFWHALFGAGVVFVTYLLGRELFDRRTGLLAAIILATSIQFFYQVRSPLQDVPLTFFVALSFLFFILLLKKNRHMFVYGFWVSLGLAVLTKGVVGFVLPVLCALVYLSISGAMFRATRRMWLHVGLGFLAFLAIVIPWHLAEYLRHGRQFLDEYLITRTLNRYLYPDLNMGDPNSVADPKWVYVPEIFGLFLPWSGFLVFSFIVAFRNLRSKSEPALLTIVWFFVMFLFFSLSSGRKFVRYLLPLFPSLALIVGSMWSKYMTGTRERFLRIGMSWSAILLIVVFGLAVVIMLLMAGRWWVPTEYEPYIVVALPFTVIFAAGVVICATLVITGKSRRAFLALALGTAISFSALVLLASVYLDEILVTKQLVGEVRNEILTCERVGSYRYPKPNSFILYANRYVTLMSRPAELDEFLEQEGRVCCIVMESDLRDVTDEFYRQGRRLDYRILAQKSGAAIIENYHK